MQTANRYGIALGVALGMTGAALAETPAAQVYDVCFSLRTTGAATARLNNKDNPFLGEEKETVVYRRPTNVEWRGLVWGCNCEAVDGVWEEVCDLGGFSTIKGCIIWDTQSKKPVFVGDGADLSDVDSIPGCGFGWQFINAIGRGGNEVEGCWTMTQDGVACDDTYTLFFLSGSGFGRLQLNKEDDYVDCTSPILYMVGKVSGWMKAPSITTEADWSGCTFCGYEPIYGECEFATAWEWGAFWDSESWMDAFDEEKTAVHGTWTYKYNEELSERLSSSPAVTEDGIDNLIVSIRQVYDFSELPAVSAAILAIENTFWGYDPSGCDEFETALAAANRAVAEAEAAVEAVKYENLKAAEVKAGLVAVAAANAWESAKDACDVTNRLYEASDAAYEKALYMETNVNATIIWKNASQDEVTNKVVGCKAIATFIAEYNGFTLIKMETMVPGMFGTRTCFTWAECAQLVKDYTDATEAAAKQLATTKADLIEAQAAVVKTAAAKQVADDAYTAAQNDLANIALLQYKAERALEKAEMAQAAAQAAYDEAGCND